MKPLNSASRQALTAALTPRLTATIFNVLHIIEQPRTAFVFFKSLHGQSDTHFNLTSVNNPQEAKCYLANQHYDALFLHFNADNAANVAEIKSLTQTTQPITLIAIVHNLSDDQISQLLDAGIDDYIKATDVATPLLPRMIHYAVERKKNHVQLQAISQLDPLTGLVNYHAFLHKLQQQINSVQQTIYAQTINTPMSNTQAAQCLTAVLLINLDQFKTINETKSHGLGDKYLQEIAERLQQAMRQSDEIARLGGDEFLILLKDMPNNDSITRVANHVLSTLAQSVIIEGYTLFTTASIGIAVQSATTKEAEALIKEADIAMDFAKQQGGNRAQFFTRDQAVATSLRKSLENELIKAIENEDFFLTFQPQMCTTTNSLYGAEVLLRWQHPIHGELSPNIFIPTLESTGLIAKVTQWVIKQALEQWQQWLASGMLRLDAHLSINLSPKFLNHPSFKRVFKELSALSPAIKSQVFFEITENLFVDPESNIDNLRFIKSCGFNLAMDDFGTGYSSLSYLKHFPLDCIKLDCAFTKDITTNPIDCAITQAVINLSADLNIVLIAEGVEDAETLKLLTAMGCDHIQGYYYARPLKVARFEAYCRDLQTPPANKKAV
ncbi:MAG: bifunctional diguanylate cyclase/phosphodiesterase [Marinagarivorans sp.]|nr:bifunctional diguanylate cyclase/phosphodiesterase [Marinagarivorans sp.]